MFFALQLQAQDKTSKQKATLIVRSEKMIEVPSIASQIADGTFVPAENIDKEFNPKRWGKNTAIPGKGLPKGGDPLREKQQQVTRNAGRDLILTFEAASSSSTPTDPTGAVGPNHFLNSWNTAFRIWDKSGNPLTAPASLSTIFPGSMGDPIVMYDRYADRFFISEFFSNGFDIAISQGPDPVNDGWYVYRFSTNTFPDYPKYSVWSDAYYITANKDQGSPGTSEVVFAVERDKMLTGDQSALMVGFPLPDIVNSGFYSPLGFNCNGSTLPPPGDAPIVYMQDDSWSGVNNDHLKLWTIDMDWTTPANSTISSPQIINTTPFDGLFDGGSFSNLPQPSGGDIDALQATIMYMAQYRRFPTYNSAIFNFVVDLDGNDDFSGIRWYELRQDNDGDPWTIYQEGTYEQPDGHSAFCGNMCMDASGNIAMAYTIVSSSQYPSLRYTGRYANDPSGTMTIAEGTIIDGTQSDPSTRYGDYAQMTIDPTDDATFWSIGELFNSNTRKNQVGVWQIAPAELTAQFAGDPTTVCTDGSVTFTDQSLGTPTSWNWTFEGATPATYSGQTPPPIVYSTVGSYDVTLEVGDGSTTDLLTLTNYITVQSIIADFSGSPTTVIVGGSVQFDDLSYCDPTSWEWTFSGGEPGSYSGSNPPLVSYNTEGVFDVSLTVTNSNGTDTETKTDYINVINCSYCETSYSNQSDDWISNITFNTIDNTTAADPNGYGDYTSLSTDVEQGQLYTLSVEVTVNGGWTQHVWAWIDWNMNCDFTDDGEAYDLGATPGTEGVHVLSMDITVPEGLTPNTTTMRVAERYNSDPEPCTTTTYGEAEDYSVNILSNAVAPVADFEADNLSPTVADTVHFTDLSSNDPTSWSWSFDPATMEFLEGTSASSQNPIVKFTDPGTYTVELTATNAAGSDTETKTNYITVSQVIAPVADFEANNLTPTVEDTVAFTDLSSNNPTSWDWTFTPATVTFADGTSNTSQSPLVIFNVAGLYIAELIAANEGGSDTETKTDYIDARDMLTVSVSGMPDELCAGETVQLNADASGGTGTYTYSWTSDPAGFTSDEQNPEVSPEVTTTYMVEVNDGEQVTNGEVLITVNLLPEITLGDWPDTLCNEEEPSVQLTATPEGGTFDGNNITPDGVFSPEEAPLGWNVISYTYTDENGCENIAQDSIFVDQCVGIDDKSIGERSVTIYPNPNGGKFTITSHSIIEEVIILNNTGAKLSEKKHNETTVNISVDLPKGTYLMRVITADNPAGILKKVVIR